MVDNQHRKIAGYRDLSEQEITAMNNVKEIEAMCGETTSALAATSTLDQRCVALARTKLQEGFMWAVRAIAQPESSL